MIITSDDTAELLDDKLRDELRDEEEDDTDDDRSTAEQL